MRILVTFAVEAEFAPWRSRRKFVRQVADGLSLWQSSIDDAEVCVLLTGIGDDKASVMDLMMRVAKIGQYFDFCISSGLAGALRCDYRLGEIVVAKVLKSAHIHKDLGRDWLVLHGCHGADHRRREVPISHERGRRGNGKF